MRRVSVVAIGPLPSMGSPRALTTRPRSASPTGTDRIRPSRARPAPLRGGPPPQHDGADRSPRRGSTRARASPSSNSNSSLTAHPGSPDTRAMPSPTSMMRPDLLGADLGRVLVDVALERLGDLGRGDRQLGHQRAPFASSSSKVRCAPGSRGAGARGTPRGGRGPWRPRGGRRSRRGAAQQRRVEGHLELDGAADERAPAIGPARPARPRRLRAARNPRRRADPGRAGLDQPVERAEEVPSPTAGDGVADKAHRRPRGLAPRRCVDQPGALGRGEIAVGRRRTQGRGRRPRSRGETEEVVLHAVELAVGLSLRTAAAYPRHVGAPGRPTGTARRRSALGEAHPGSSSPASDAVTSWAATVNAAYAARRAAGRHLSLEQVGDDGTRAGRDRGVGERRAKRGSAGRAARSRRAPTRSPARATRRRRPATAA